MEKILYYMKGLGLTKEWLDKPNKEFNYKTPNEVISEQGTYQIESYLICVMQGM